MAQDGMVRSGHRSTGSGKSLDARRKARWHPLCVTTVGGIESMRLSSLPSALPLLAAFGLAACSSPLKSSSGDFANSSASLVRAASCADLTTNLRADANAKIDASIDHAIAMVRAYGPSYWWYGYGRGGAVYDDAATGAPVASPSAPGANAGAAGGAESTPKASTYTDTNTQVAGVDEADIAKTDGRYLWVLHGAQLRTMKAFPTAQLADLGNGSALDLEGSPMEMFVHEGKAVVFSQVDGTRLYQGANLPNRGDYNDVQALGAPVAMDGYPGSYPYYRPMTKVTVLSVENNAPRVLSEQYFEGNYVSSRRVGNQVRIVLTGALHEPRTLAWDQGWYAPPATIAEAVARLETVRTRLHASVNATSYRDWLPVSFRALGIEHACFGRGRVQRHVLPAGGDDASGHHAGARARPRERLGGCAEYRYPRQHGRRLRQRR
jgi:Beta propeller domain